MQRISCFGWRSDSNCQNRYRRNCPPRTDRLAAMAIDLCQVSAAIHWSHSICDHSRVMHRLGGLGSKLPNGCCQTNQLKHQKPGERAFYEAIRERHSVRAASRFSLKVLRVDSDLCELNRLWNEAWIEINQQNEYSLSNHLKIRKNNNFNNLSKFVLDLLSLIKLTFPPKLEPRILLKLS